MGWLGSRKASVSYVHLYQVMNVADLSTVGMRFAKLEQNLITAYFIASFDFELEDKQGHKMSAVAPMDFNRHSAHKPKINHILRVTPRRD